MSDTKRTIEEVVNVIRVMPYQFTLTETAKFTSLLNQRLDEILEIHKAEKEERKLMSKYREPSEPQDVSFKDLEIIEKLLESKKLTDKQKEAVKSLLSYYYSTD